MTIKQLPVSITNKPKRSALSRAAGAMGRKGGKKKSEKKTLACRENGKKGGRPIKEKK